MSSRPGAGADAAPGPAPGVRAGDARRAPAEDCRAVWVQITFLISNQFKRDRRIGFQQGSQGWSATVPGGAACSPPRLIEEPGHPVQPQQAAALAQKEPSL